MVSPDDPVLEKGQRRLDAVVAVAIAVVVGAFLGVMLLVLSASSST